MARIFTEPFEWDSPWPSGWWGVSGTLTRTRTTTKYSGDYAWSLALPTSASSYFIGSVVSGFPVNRSLYARFRFRVPTLPTSGQIFYIATLNFTGISNTVRLTVRLRNDGSGAYIEFYNDQTSTAWGSTSAGSIAADTWYTVSLGGEHTSTTNINIIAKLGSTTVVNTTATVSSGCDDWHFNLGSRAANSAAFTCIYDDLAINDNSGSYQNSWPSITAKTIRCLPISDFSRTEWVKNSGGTTTLYDAVNNDPPEGIAAATSPDNKYLKHPGNGSGTGQYVANMESYTTKGVPSGSTINLVQPMISMGEEINTGNKLVRMKCANNPAGVSWSDNLNVTITQGSFAHGTYNTQWYTPYAGVGADNAATGSDPAIVYDPSVTLSSSPQMEIQRPETASRVASICYMALYVEYEEPSGTTVTADITTNAPISATITSDLTTSAVISATATSELTTNAVVGFVVTSDLTTDASIAIISTVTLDVTTDASISATALSNITTDASVSSTARIDLATDAPISTTASIELSTDAAVSTLISADLTTDAPISTTNSAELLTDASLNTTAQSSVTTDAVVGFVITVDLTTDAAISIVTVVTIDIATDAPISTTATLELATNASLSTTVQIDLSTDASVGLIIDLSVTTDAAVSTTSSIELTTDAVVGTIIETSVTTDAHISILVSTDLTTDASLSTTNSADLTTDASINLAGVVTIDLNTDAALSTTNSAELATDAIIGLVITLDLSTSAAVSSTVQTDITTNSALSTTNLAVIATDSAISATVQSDLATSAPISATLTNDLSTDASIFIGATVTIDILSDACIAVVVSLNLETDAAITAVFILDISTDAVIAYGILQPCIVVASDRLLVAVYVSDALLNHAYTTDSRINTAVQESVIGSVHAHNSESVRAIGKDTVNV